MIENPNPNSQKEGDAESRASGKFGSGESKKRTVFSANRTTILMGVTFLAGLGWIAMTRQNVKSFAQSEIELGNNFLVEMGVRDMRRQLPHSGREIDPEVGRLGDALHVETSERQIPANELKKNPFVQYVSDEEDPARRRREDDEVDNAPSTEGLILQMTLVGGGVRSATISGFVMHEGDIVNGWKVLEIKSNQVVIENSGKKHVLSRNLHPMTRSTATGKQ